MNGSRVITWKRLMPWITLFTLFVLLQFILFSRLLLTYHEGLSLQLGWLIERGYRPYSEIFTLSLPLFAGFAGWLGRLGLDEFGFKLVFLLFGLLTLGSTAILAAQWLNRSAALAAALVLATSPSFLAGAAAVIDVLPALGLGLLSLVVTLRSSPSRSPLWPLLGGGSWGLALLFSPVAASLAPVALLFLGVQRRRQAVEFRWIELLKNAGLWLVGALVVLGAGGVVVGPDIRFVGDQWAILRTTLPLSQVENFKLIGQFIGFNFWLFFLAAYALVRIEADPDHPLWLMLLWALFSFGWLMLQVPLRLIDPLILLPPLAIIAGWGALDLVQRSRVALNGHLPLWRGLVLAVLVVYGWSNWNRLDYLNLRHIDTEGKMEQLAQRDEIVGFIQAHTNPDDCVIIDDAALAVAARRLPAPQLAALSPERMEGGLLPPGELTNLVQEHGCTAIVFSRREYTLPLSDLGDWASQNFPHEEKKFTRTRIYYR